MSRHALILLPLLSPAMARADGGAGLGYHMHDYGWGMIFGPLMMLVLIGLVVALALLILRAFGVMPSGSSRSRQILEERFARGEIDAAEFAERRKALDT